MTGRVLAALVATCAAASSAVLQGCSPDPSGERPAAPTPVEVGEVFRDPWSPVVAGGGLDDLAAGGGRVVRFRTPYAVVRVAVSAPADTTPPGPPDSGEPRPAAPGADVRALAWEGSARPDVVAVLGVEPRPLSWTLALVAEGEEVVLGGAERSDLPPSSGAARIVAGVPEGADLALALEVEGETQVVPVDPGGPPDRGAVSGLAPLRVTTGPCRARAPGGLGVDVLAHVTESTYWPGLGWAPDGRTWRAVRLTGELAGPGARPLPAYRMTLVAGGGRPRPVGDVPFAGAAATDLAAVFAVPPGRPPRAVRLAAPGSPEVTCTPAR